METLKQPSIEAYPGYEGVVERLNAQDQIEHDSLELIPRTEDERKGRLSSHFWRFAGRFVLAGTVGAGAGVAGVALTDTEVQLGPESCRTHLTFDGRASIKGSNVKGYSSISLPMPLELPGSLGVDAECDSLPFRFTKHGIALSELTRPEIEAYGSLHANYEQNIAEVKNKLLLKFGLFAGLGEGILLAGWAGTNLLRRWRPALDPWAIKTARFALAGMLCASGALPVASAYAQGEPNSNIENAYPGFPFNGVVVEGELLDFIESNKRFYDLAEKNAKKALKNFPENSDDEFSFLVIEGNKCNVGAARVQGTIADLADVDAVIDVGDAALGGVVFDEFCLKNEAHQFEGRSFYRVRGNHDPVLDDSELKQMGVTPLGGQAIEHDGLYIVGEDNPSQNTFTGDKRWLGNDGPQAIRKDLAELCAANGAFIAVANQPWMVEETFQQGCAPLVLTGGEERELLISGNVSGASSYQYRAKSSGGADRTDNDAKQLSTAGRLIVPAEQTVFTYNKSTGALSYSVITLYPDAAVTVENFRLDQPLPTTNALHNIGLIQ